MVAWKKTKKVRKVESESRPVPVAQKKKLNFLSLNLKCQVVFFYICLFIKFNYSNLFQLLGSEKPENIQEIKLSHQFDNDDDHDCVCDDDDGNAVAGKSNEKAEMMTNTIMMVLIV